MPSRESARLFPGGRKSRNTFTPGSRSKISNLMITELFYFYILDMSRGFLCIRRFRRIHLSVFRYRLTKLLYGPEKFPSLLRKRPPARQVLMFVSFSVLSSKTRVFSCTFHVYSPSFPVPSLSVIFSNFNLGSTSFPGSFPWLGGWGGKRPWHRLVTCPSYILKSA